MNKDIYAIRSKANELKIELAELERKIAVLERTCPHEWKHPEKHINRTESHIIPGDEPGTMGVDFRGPVRVPAKEEVVYIRRCNICGKAEKTTKTRPTKEVPVFES